MHLLPNSSIWLSGVNFATMEIIPLHGYYSSIFIVDTQSVAIYIHMFVYDTCMYIRGCVENGNNRRRQFIRAVFVCLLSVFLEASVRSRLAPIRQQRLFCTSSQSKLAEAWLVFYYVYLNR